MDEVTLEIAIDELFENGVRAQGRAGGREYGYHISGMGYDCLLNIQFGMEKQKEWIEHPEKFENEPEEDFTGVMNMWVGTQLHLTPLTPKHEWGVARVLTVNGQKVKILGHIDEIFECEDDGSEVIIDKKFVGYIPKTPNDHYVKQVGYYSALYSSQTGAVVKWGALKYVIPTITPKDRAMKVTRSKTWVFPIDTNALLAELDDKVIKIATAMQNGTYVDRKPGWLCKYCKYVPECIAKKGPFDGQQTLDEPTVEGAGN